MQLRIGFACWRSDGLRWGGRDEETEGFVAGYARRSGPGSRRLRRDRSGRLGRAFLYGRGKTERLRAGHGRRLFPLWPAHLRAALQGMGQCQRKRLPRPGERYAKIGGLADLDRAARKQESGGDIVLYGSASFMQTLMKHDLIDEFRISIHPIVLGRGKRLFPEVGETARLRLAGAKALDSGVTILTYLPAD